MSFETDIAQLQRKYPKPVADNSKVKLEGELLALFAKHLLADGRSEVDINKKYRELSRLTHPDKLRTLKAQTSKEHQQAKLLKESIIELDDILGDGRCFAILTNAKQRLTNVNPLAGTVGDEVKGEDILYELSRREQDADSAFEKMMLQSLHFLIRQKMQCNEIINQQDPDWVKVHFVFSTITSSAMAYLFMTEIALAYTAAAGFKVAGNAMAEGDSSVLQTVGRASIYLGDATFFTATGLLAHLVNLNNLVVTLPYSGYSQIKTVCYKALSQEPVKLYVFNDRLLSDLSTRVYRYVNETSKQWGLYFRQAGVKLTLLDEFLQELKTADDEETNSRSKAERAWEIVERYLMMPDITKGRTDDKKSRAETMMIELKYRIKREYPEFGNGPKPAEPLRITHK